jgi:hypothetical protein
MFSYKNIWSCDDPNYNPAFHISFKNLAVMGMMCLFVAYIRYEPDMSLALYATKILSYGFICMIIIKTARAYEILYGWPLCHCVFSLVSNLKRRSLIYTETVTLRY